MNYGVVVVEEDRGEKEQRKKINKNNHENA